MSTRRLDMTLLARADIIDVLGASDRRFGPVGRRRYEMLLGLAFEDLLADPLRQGSLERSELGEGTRTYHLRFSRDRVGPPGERVKTPRHLLVYELPDPATVLVLRVLHDAMDLRRHVSRDID